jgi:hypothetical protein
VDANGSEVEIVPPGQPLFLQYRPDSLIRGRPADKVAWLAVDRFGEHAGSATVEVNIQCEPGYFYEEVRPESCQPCGYGQYNLPAVRDQVGGRGAVTADGVKQQHGHETEHCLL